MRKTSKNTANKLKNSIQTRCDQVRDSWTDSERAVRKLWAQMAQRRLVAAALAREPVR
ncbi:hypothetical protein Pr1d_42520 [Bythopirellula goksoeyrii]|uniref:Uncharacterized protein n=1 Tax=Bythopirellula goksoeyrii TaxID=1400387 RepID=A0A5B9QH30_9BACT|nr:hypothetical protein Pr1d_42520 [Bythopirellula goksoeyrii]